MTTNTSAVYAVNAYVWALLYHNAGWREINGSRPIIPATQEPEFAQYSDPFIVYGTASEWPGYMWWLQNEQCAYTIYSPSVGQVNEAVRVLNEAFIRMDEAAADLNAYIKKLPQWGDYYRGLHFKSVEIVSSQSAGALEEEGGRQSGLVVIRYRYVTQPDMDFTPDFTP